MIELIELLGHLDWFERLEELIRSLVGVESWRFSVPRSCGWSGYEIEQLLRRHGVKIWGRNYSRTHLFFRVKRRQANWAEYMLWRRGIPVSSRPFNPKNPGYRERHYPGSEPPNNRTREQPSNWFDELLSRLF